MSARMSAFWGLDGLLGGDVVGRAEHLALVGQAAVDGSLAGHLGQAEVEHLDHRLVPIASQHQVARLDVAVDHAVLVGVLEAECRLVHEIAGVGHRQRAALLDELGQVVTLDVLHREDDALADPRRRVGGDDVGVIELRRGADLAEEPLQHALAVQEVRADDLEDLLPPHHPVLGQVDDAHAAASQFAEDLVVRVLGQARRQRAGRWRRGRARLFAQLRQPRQRRADRRNRLGPGLSIPEPAHEAVRGDLGNAAAARVALLQVLDDRLGQQVVELAQAIGLQGLVGRVKRRGRPSRPPSSTWGPSNLRCGPCGLGHRRMNLAFIRVSSVAKSSSNSFSATDETRMETKSESTSVA